jgi:hypothetical protein
MPNLMRLKFLSSEVIIHALALVCILLTVEGKQLIYGNGSGTRCGGSKGIGIPLQGADKADPEQGELMIFIQKWVKRERVE